MTRQTLSRLLVQALILFLAVAGSIGALLTGFAIPIPPAVLITAAALSLLLPVVLHAPRRGLIFVGLILLLGIVLFALQAMVISGGTALINLGLTHLNDTMNWSFTLLAGSAAMTPLALTTLLLLTAALALGASAFVCLLPNLPGLVFVTLLPAALPFIFLITPHLLSVGMLVCSWFSLWAYCVAADSNPLSIIHSRRFTRFRHRRRSIKRIVRAPQLAALCMVPVVGIAMLASAYLVPQENWQRPINAADAIGLRLPFAGSMRRGDLNHLGSLFYTGQTVLKVRSTIERPLYLRGFTGAVFTGEGWSSADDAAYNAAAQGFAPPAPQNYYAQTMAYWEMPINGRRWSWQPVSYELSVQNLSSDPDALFIPAGLRTDVASLGDAWFVQDGAAATNSLRDYTLEAYTLTAALPSLYYSADSPETRSLYVNAPYWGRYGTEAGTLTAEAAAAYRAYVYDTYTALPESTLAAAQALCQAYGITPALYDAGEWRYLDLSVTADTIADTMAALCRYTVNPPQKPADADFATWFLNDARSGYCVHFATTATILLRSMGIPARYAEGYTVAASDYQQERDADGYIAIPDYRSHAWVEVFSPSQMEWIPVEVTPGYTNSAGQTTPEDNTAADTPAPAMPETARFSQQGLTEDECREALCICHAMLNALRAAQHGMKKALFCLRFGL